MGQRRRVQELPALLQRIMAAKEILRVLKPGPTILPPWAEASVRRFIKE